MGKFLNFLKRFYILIIILLIYIPLLVIVIWSFSMPSVKGNIQNGFEWNGFNNYIELFKNNEFLNAFCNTLIITFIVTPISLVIATITCFAIWQSNKFLVNSTKISSNISVINPEIITGISLTLLLSSTWVALGLNLGLFTIILSHISFCTPYAIIAIYPQMSKMKKNLINASTDLGYNLFQTFFKVVIPYLLPSLIAAGALVFAMSFDDFIITNLVKGRVNTISTQMYTMAKGIKMWAVTFGSLLLIIFTIFISIKSIFIFKKEKWKESKKTINLINSSLKNKTKGPM